MKLAIINISNIFSAFDKNPLYLQGKDMLTLPAISDAYMILNNGIIEDYGSMKDFDYLLLENVKSIDASHRFVLPAWCDSHSHIVFAQTREHEFVDKISGLTYEEIAKRGGGILNSVEKLRQMSEEELLEGALKRVSEVISFGTGALEIKSGYGLTLEDELKMLRVIRTLKETTPLTIKSTFLGAHAVPIEYKGRQDEYVKYVIEKMLPHVADEKLADYIDVFCDTGFFTVSQSASIIEAAYKYGLKAKIHANELDYSGGVQLGVKYNAISVDHLEMSGEEEIQSLLNSETVPTLLPNVSFYLKIPYAPARKMIDSGLGVAVASDFNPGSSPSGNMQLAISLACIQYRLFPEEAINAVTINGAKAMEVHDELGTITKGKKANLLITKQIPSLNYIPYSFGENKIDTVILNGQIIYKN